jgi:Tfp pilus assembly protein PilO
MKIKKREKLFLAVGALTAILLATVYWVVFPFMESKEGMVTNIEQKKKKLETYKARLQRKPEMLKELKTLQAQKARLQTQILVANDPGEAEAKLRDTLNQYAQANGVTITRTNVLPEEKLKDGYRKISLDFNVTADIGPLTRFLYGLTSNPNYLEIRQVQINAWMNRNQVVIQPRITLAALVRKG